MADKDNKYTEGIGRRKSAVARVRLFPSGTSKSFIVNGQDQKEYFDIERLRQASSAPLKFLDATSRKNLGVEVKVRGGGIMAQSEAVALGIARAMVKINEDLKQELRTAGYLTRDPRKVDRKKFGLKKARRAPQWRKR